MKYLYTCTLVLFISSVIAQPNLIRNPSLEVWENGTPKNWKIISHTPDIFKSNLKIIPGGVEAETMSMRKEFPDKGYDGLSYFGIVSNEIMQGELNTPLIKGKEYLISCWVYKPVLYTNDVSNKFTINFSDTSMLEKTSNQFINEAYVLRQNSQRSVTTQNWHFISTSFVAKGNEKYFQVGFFNRISKQAKQLFYLFDNFKLSEIRSSNTSKKYYFDTKVFALNNTQKQQLDDYINSYVKIDSILIKGYTDEIGNEKANQALSFKRCNEIKSFIQKIRPDIKYRVDAKGEKESQGKDLKEYRKVELTVYHHGITPLPENIPEFDGDLMKVLKGLKENDQFFRVIIDSLTQCCEEDKKEIIAQTKKEMAKRDIENMIKFREILVIFDYPGLSKVSPDYMNVMVLLLLHSDLKTMETYVELIRQEMLKGEVSKTWYAMLVDRIQAEKHLPQIYGSELQWDKQLMKYSLLPLEDKTLIEKNRLELGLSDLQSYVTYRNGLKKHKVVI